MDAVYSRRRARAGETQNGCLLFICLLVVAGFVGYNYFIKNYNLKHAGEQVYAWTDRNSDAFLMFRKKIVMVNIPDTIMAAKQTRKLFADLKGGKIDQKTFDKEASKQINRYSDLIDTVNGMAAPQVFHKPAIRLAKSHGDFFQCLTKLQRLPSAKTDQERKDIYDSAWKSWTSGWDNVHYAKRYIRLDITFEQTK